VALAHELDARTVIELGVRGGCSTVAWLYALERRGHLWSVDLNPPTRDLGHHEHWTFLGGDDCSPVVYHALPMMADVVFIDTSHAYEHTLQELELYVPRVRSGGRVLLHDTEVEMPDGTSGPTFPVVRAVEEYCSTHRLAWTNNPACNGLADIRVP
jgi:predicted O-methyltransferase YrrM